MHPMCHMPPLALLNILQVLASKLRQPRGMQIRLPLGVLPLLSLHGDRDRDENFQRC